MRRMRRSVKRKIALIMAMIVVQLLLSGIFTVTVKKVTEQKYVTLLAEKETVIQLAKRVAYVTVKEVRAGEAFTEENIEKRYLLSEQSQETLAEEVFGMMAAADLPAGVIVNTALCHKQEENITERECILTDILFAEQFPAYALIDIRIRYPNGENYCVLRKKRLRRAGEKEDCCLCLSETEQLLFSGAQYDIERYKGAMLYAVGFVEEPLQEVAEGTYLPPAQVLLQICETEADYQKKVMEWKEKRAALEMRMEEAEKEYEGWF